MTLLVTAAAVLLMVVLAILVFLFCPAWVGFLFVACELIGLGVLEWGLAL